ncbi:MAG: DUF3306 domain-containing protein [Pseudomonadota bacterium]
MTEENEKFLSRWSRLKQGAREEPETPLPAAPAVDPEAPPPDLPPVGELTMDSDFRGFFHPKVNEDLRRTALKKLFSDPHFNLMDGLDTYIDDYSKSDPLPAAMLAQLKHAQKIIGWAREMNEKTQQDEKKAGTATEPEVVPVAHEGEVPPLTDQTTAAMTVPEQSAPGGEKPVTVAGKAETA